QLEVLAERLDHRRYVSTAKGRISPLDDLHVLLRHRLLREAGGFEGLRPIREHPPLNDEAVPNRVDDGLERLHGKPAALSGSSPARQTEDLVTSVEQLDDVGGEVVEVSPVYLD